VVLVLLRAKVCCLNHFLPFLLHVFFLVFSWFGVSENGIKTEDPAICKAEKEFNDPISP
jgi:hypothetical protein